LATSGISSSLLSQIASSPSTANAFLTDLNQLAKDLQSGNLSGAQDDFVTLSQDALDGATSSSATTSASGVTGSLLSEITSSAGSSNSFAGELNQIGADLENGDLSSAQRDLLSLDSTALNAASLSGAPPSTPSSGGNRADSSALINAVVQAMDAGDSSFASSALTQLASISPSSAGAGELQQLGQSLSGSGSSSQASSINELMQSADVNAANSDSSLSILSLFA
jgi:hypothetical protein